MFNAVCPPENFLFKRKFFRPARRRLFWKEKAGSSSCPTRLFQELPFSGRLLARSLVAAAARGGRDAGQAGAEQNHRRRFGDSRLLCAGDLTGERDGLPRVDGQIVHTE